MNHEIKLMKTGGESLPINSTDPQGIISIKKVEFYRIIRQDEKE